MKEIVTEELLQKIDNRFLLSIVAAKRARQIKDGAIPLVDSEVEGTDGSLAVALSEVNADKIKVSVEKPNATAEEE